MFRRKRPAPMTFGAGPYGPLLPQRPKRFKNIRRLFRAGRWITGRGYTHRRKLTPVYAGALMYIAAAVAHTAVEGARSVAALSVVVAALAALWQYGRFRRRRPVRLHRAIHSWAAYATAAAWIWVGARVGVAPPMPGFLLIWVVLVMGAPWWWHHRVRHVAPVTTDGRIAVWQERVACNGGALTDAVLEQVGDATTTDRSGKTKVVGWTAIIRLPGGKLTTDQATAATTRIASAFGVAAIAVVVERMPGGEEDYARLTVYEVNPLHAVRPFEMCLDTTTGVAEIGTYADGKRALYRMWRPGSGPTHDLLAGATEAGKSRAVEVLLAMERHTSGIASVVVDPQRGQSLPEWRHAVALFADSAERGMAAVRAVRDEMYRRNELLATVNWTDEQGRPRSGISFFDPAHPVIRDLGLPLIVLTIEEASAFLALPGAKALVEDIAKMGRKCGIKVRLVVQVPLLDQLGSMTLREQVVAGNVIILRTANKLTGQVAFNGVLPVDPALLPREWPDGSSTGGLGYVLGPQARAAMCRIDYMADPVTWATTGETTLLPEVTAAYASYLADVEKDPTASPAAAPVDGANLTERILAYLAGRASATTGAIARDLSAPLSSVSSACSRAVEAGTLRAVSRGVWALPDPAPTDTQPEASDDIHAEQLEAATAA